MLSYLFCFFYHPDSFFFKINTYPKNLIWNNTKTTSLRVTDEMQTICKTHFLQQVYRKIEGAVLDSQNERNLDCVTTFQTHSILQRFMIHFDRLQLDCNDHLFIFDGAHAVGQHKVGQLIIVLHNIIVV